MKIIEAMRRIKYNQEKIADLQNKISAISAYQDIQPTEYKDQAPSVCAAWVQTCMDLSLENVRLNVAITKTNVLTPVTINIGGKDITKSIAEWILRRRIYAKSDEITWSRLTDKGLKPVGYMKEEDGKQIPAFSKVILCFDPKQRDEKIAEFRSEPSLINAALEIVNAITDLVEA